MERQKERPDEDVKDWYKSYKKVRKDWGGIKPATRVEKNKKGYNRKKENKKWRKEIDGSI